MFVTPSIVMMAFVGVYGVADGLSVSDFVGSETAAAINYVMPLVTAMDDGYGRSFLIVKRHSHIFQNIKTQKPYNFL